MRYHYQVGFVYGDRVYVKEGESSQNYWNFVHWKELGEKGIHNALSGVERH